jgi:hypothetical protein
MPTIWHRASRAALIERLHRLDADSRPRWGTLSCPQMVAHLTEAARMALGELPVAPMGPSYLRRTPIKQFIIYLYPFPRGASTAPELLQRRCDNIEREMVDLEAALERLAAQSGALQWPEHPLFGRLSPRAIGVLAYRHMDHHLRQFGV